MEAIERTARRRELKMNARQTWHYGLAALALGAAVLLTPQPAAASNAALPVPPIPDVPLPPIPDEAVGIGAGLPGGPSAGVGASTDGASVGASVAPGVGAGAGVSSDGDAGMGASAPGVAAGMGASATDQSAGMGAEAPGVSTGIGAGEP
jgi:hypothetical protein